MKKVRKQSQTASALKKISIISCLLKLVPVVMGIITAKLMSRIVEQAVNGQTHAVLQTGLIIISTVTVIKIFLIVTEISYRKAESKVLHQCKMELYRGFLSNPLSVLYATERGTAKEKLNDDFNTVTQKHVSQYPSFVVGVITTVAYFIVLARKNLLVAGILSGMSLLQIIPPLITNKFLQVNYDNCRDIEAELTDFTVSGYRGFQVIKLYGLKQWWLGKLKEYHKKYAKIGSSSIYAGTAEGTLGKFIATIIKYGTYAILGLLIMAGHAEMDVAVEAIALSAGFFAAMQGIFEAIPRFGVAKVAGKRLREWYTYCQQTNGEEVPAEKGSIELDKKIRLHNVSCRFEEKVILQDAGIVLEMDKLCVIRGENGIGKSTLFKLMTGLLPCEQGEIRVGGVKPEEFKDAFFPGRLFYLPQMDTEFDFKPMELYEMLGAQRLAAIREMAERFGLMDEQLMDTNISDLSGGERKKVYLALAFAMEPDVLLLDEPTNSLDQESKLTLVKLLQERSGGAVVITHDPIFDEVAERFYRMAEGGITIENV